MTKDFKTTTTVVSDGMMDAVSFVGEVIQAVANQRVVFVTTGSNYVFTMVVGTHLLKRMKELIIDYLESPTAFNYQGLSCLGNAEITVHGQITPETVQAILSDYLTREDSIFPTQREDSVCCVFPVGG